MSLKQWIVLSLVAGTLCPAIGSAATYEIDSSHTYPSLEMPHMGISVWRGKFDKSTGVVMFDPTAKTGSVDIRVDTDSIDFGLADMHKVAVTPDWLDVAKFPEMTYTGTLRSVGARRVAVDGQLTLRGVTKPLVLTINSFKCIEHPYYKKQVCGADAEGDLDRADFGMTKYADNGLGKIHLRIQVEGIKKD